MLSLIQANALGFREYINVMGNGIRYANEGKAPPDVSVDDSVGKICITRLKADLANW